MDRGSVREESRGRFWFVMDEGDRLPEAVGRAASEPCPECGCGPASWRGMTVRHSRRRALRRILCGACGYELATYWLRLMQGGHDGC